ncbi:hypothetical protein Pars_2144 [Pyrobaculum arsenaticum DSM 13514]|nr:hypothetical protein Pars_2144 [Pyrobaculum arsenaticum DSM 13514]
MAVSPQDVYRFFIFGSILNPSLRFASIMFHISIITSLFGHLFIFVKNVDPLLPKIGTAVGITAFVFLSFLIATRKERDKGYLFVSLLTLSCAISGVFQGLVAPRQYLVEMALTYPREINLASTLLVFHVLCASILAISLPKAMTSHVTSPILFLVLKIRGRKLRMSIQKLQRQIL